jgi:cytochrome P450
LLFLEPDPGTYTCFRLGGGRRRCLGASFALVEMNVVLKTILQRYDMAAASPERERSRRRSITIAPRAGARTILVERVPAARPEPIAA